MEGQREDIRPLTPSLDTQFERTRKYIRRYRQIHEVGAGHTLHRAAKHTLPMR